MIIDEIGPYEVEKGLGWAAILPLLGNLPSKVTLITYRPSLITYFSRHYPNILAFDRASWRCRKSNPKIEELLSAGEIYQKFAF